MRYPPDSVRTVNGPALRAVVTCHIGTGDYAIFMREGYYLRMDEMIEPLHLATYSGAPRYNIQAVEKATGMSSRTLRSWERRYGVPAPRRDTQGRRLYSDQDIALIRWLLRRVEQGMSVSRAVALHREEGSPGETTAPNLDELQPQLLQAIDWMNEAAARRVLSQALAAAPVEAVMLDLIQPVLYRVGDLWQAGILSVGSEHFGSHLLRTAVAEQLQVAPPPTRPHHIMVGCAPGELHDIGALVFAFFARRAGFPVTFLGANVDGDGLLRDLQRLGPAALCLSATTAGAAESLAALYDRTDATFGGVLAYSGQAFAEATDRKPEIPGLFLGTDVRTAADRLAEAL